ncbi:MAG: YjzC family protein [Anaerolineae bacterium]|nr:YjzC family protein [Anaerolineae bacterium]
MYKTGDTAPQTGRYEFVRYTDGTTTPPPTAEERVIPLTKGKTFPPIRSCNKAAWWKLL